jgi:multiple sugar transport system permease protein
MNSLVIGVMAALAVTLSSAFVAFGFAYFRFPGRNLVFGLVLATMMLPTAVTMIPNYLVWNWLGLTNPQVPLWAHNLFGSAFYIFLLRQFFLGLPGSCSRRPGWTGPATWDCSGGSPCP